MGQARDSDTIASEGGTLARLCEALQRTLEHPSPHGLTRSLCELLEVDMVLLAELPMGTASTTATVLEGWRLGRPAPWFTYTLEGSPCRITLREGMCVHPEGVARAFPEDLALADDGIEGYAGKVLYDRDGVARGLLIAVAPSAAPPRLDPPGIRLLLGAGTGRAGAQPLAS
jgi:hypothetical protein